MMMCEIDNEISDKKAIKLLRAVRNEYIIMWLLSFIIEPTNSAGFCLHFTMYHGVNMPYQLNDAYEAEVEAGRAEKIWTGHLDSYFWYKRGDYMSRIKLLNKTIKQLKENV